MEVMRRNERGQQEEEDEVEEVMVSLQGRRRSTIHPHRAEEAAEDAQEFLKDRHIHLAPEEEAEEKTDAESNYGFPGMQLASVKLSISDVNNENEELDFAVKRNGKQELNTVKTNGDQELGVTGETNGDQELDDTINTNGDLQFDASYKSYGDQESNTGKKSNETWEFNVMENDNRNQDLTEVSEVNRNFGFNGSGNPELEVEEPKSKVASDDIPGTPVKQHSEENLQAESSSSSSLPSVPSWDPQILNFHPYGNAIFENEEIIQIKNVGQEYSVGKGSDQKLKDVDVVTVLQKQETHDLFCPNCNSCITKRVILRKRKRMLQDIQQQAKRDKFENLIASEINTIPEDSTIPVADSTAGNGEPEVFRCLSCLSFFIPKGRGFKLFGIFGGRSGGENMTPGETTVNLNQSPHLPSAVPEENRFDTDALHSHIENVETVKQVGTSIHHENMLASQEISDSVVEVHQRPDEAVGNMSISAEETHSVSKIELPLSIQPFHGPEHVTNGTFKLNTAEEDSVVSEMQESTLLEKLESDAEKRTDYVIEKITEVSVVSTTTSVIEIHHSEIDNRHDVVVVESKTVSTMDNGFSSTVEASAYAHSLEIPDACIDEAPKLNITEDSIAAEGPPPLQKLVTAVGKTSDGRIEKIKEEDVIITVEAGPSTEVVTQSGEENLVEVNEVQQWDILKSIVYGGQVESITSLGVVLSAAGADTSTVNVLALGLANLIGGLFIIGHNLRDLKKEQSYQPSTENDEQVDRYTETLGRRENFIRHAVVAMLAFLIFGLLPPIIYGFTFRASDDRDYKCIAVLAASLFCIALLALGKAHTKSPPKSYFKTVVYFVSIAIVASGASFIVGSLIKKLLDKLGWFETSTSSTIYMPFAEATHSGSWSSF